MDKMGKIKKLFKFIKYNRHKWLSLIALFWSAIYRIEILTMKPKRLRKYWGEEGKESSRKEEKENYRYAVGVAYAVDRICTRTTWESKCLVRALTAQHMLSKKGIHTTLYLGCRLEEEKMVAHAWLRCGEMYVTGGNGEGYAIVSKFYK